jgi:hypothetical protein
VWELKDMWAYVYRTWSTKESRKSWERATHKAPQGIPEHTMSPATRCAKNQAKARHRRHLQAQERLARDCRQAQHAAKVLDVPRSTLQAWQADQDRRVCSF